MLWVAKSTATMVLALLALAPLASAQRTLIVDQNHVFASDDGPGTSNRPWKTLTRATLPGSLQPGDTLLIHGGTYRESLLLPEGGDGPDRRIVITSAPGEEVIITGADTLGNVAREGQEEFWVIENYTVLPWPSSYERFGRDQLIMDGTPLKPVQDQVDLVPGAFWVETPERSTSRVWVLPPEDEGRKPEDVSFEAVKRFLLFGPPYVRGRRTECFNADGPSWVMVKGITFRYAANMAQHGAVCLGGEGSILENVTVEWTSGLGIQVTGVGQQVRNSRTRRNGQAGIGGSCVGCLIDHVTSAYNNTRQHSPFWEAGGGKWSRSSEVTFDHFVSIGNDGPGLWLDIDNSNIAISNSLFEDNLVAGLFIELNSTDVSVSESVFKNTRRRDWAGAGILIQAAGRSTIENNYFGTNEGAGIWLREDDRADGGHNVIRGNIFDTNAVIPGQDRADLQIDSPTHSDICSNALQGNSFLGEASYRFYVGETHTKTVGLGPPDLDCSDFDEGR